MILEWAAVLVVAATGLFVLVVRRRLAAMQSLVVGGAIGTGCIVAQAVALLVLAAGIAILLATGFF